MDSRRESAKRETAIKGILENMANINDYDMTQIIERAFIAGMPAVQLVSRYDEIKKFAEKNKLPEISGERLSGFLKASNRPARWTPIWWVGIPVPHLHFEAKILEMTTPQWKQFSELFMQSTLTNVGAVLQNAKEISFGDLQQAANAASQIRR
jgi:hypothetical protein